MKAILTYHSIDDSGSPVSISESVFRDHLAGLVDAGVRTVGLRTLLELPPETDAAALTFDDGFDSFGRLAWPLLEERGIPATLFVVTDRVGGNNRWDADRTSIPDLRLHDWAELGRLAEAGVELGSHTRSHVDLTAVGSGRIHDEVEGSAERMEREIGYRPTVFAYPFGRQDETASAAVREIYELACTTELRPLDSSERRHLLPRIDAYYLRRAGAVCRWGSPRLIIRLGLRRLGRRVREMVAGRARP